MNFFASSPNPAEAQEDAPSTPTNSTTPNAGSKVQAPRAELNVRQEDRQYADLELLTTKRHGGLDEYFFKVPKQNGGGKKGAKGAANSKLGAHSPTEQNSKDQFDIVTTSAFDMVEVDGKKVPRYISAGGRHPSGSGGLGSRVGSGEDWVMVTPTKIKA